MSKIDNVNVGDKFTFGYTDYIVEVTTIRAVRFQTGEVQSRIHYTDALSQDRCLSGSMFFEFLDNSEAVRIGGMTCTTD